ncbi:MAG: serine/threonine protein kinase [Deltaproteobacteria bacterium]|nr:serine/threonine protein kinase [Deltaproteobacteria bacterium]
MSESPTLDGRAPRDGDRVDAHKETLHAPGVGTPVPHDASAPAAPRADEEASHSFASWTGRTIDDRYRIESLLGEGGMGAVMLAEHLKLSKKVALKVILPQFAGMGELAERFAREAMASAKLDHPHIASALDYGTLSEGGAYLVMQLVRGESLRETMKHHVGDWAFACEVGAQIADALSAAHTARIVHRDLKPENVMLEARDDGSRSVHVRVLDFGVARVVGDDAAEGPGTRKLTRVGAILGTPGYMAPEQALGESVDERADLYALGVLLWECIVGSELFHGADVPAIVTAQLTQPIQPIALRVPNVPAELDALVSRLLAPRREDRPAKAAEVRDTLRRLALTRQLERVSGSGAFSVDVPRPSSFGTMPAMAAVARPSSDAQRNAAQTKLPLASLLPPAARSRTVYAAAAGAMALGLVITGIALGSLLGGGGATAPPITATAPTPTVITPPTIVVPPPTVTVPTTPSTPSTPTITPTITPTATGAPMTPEIARDLAILLQSETRETRRTAATSLLARPPETLPPLVSALAQLELAEGCSAKRNALRALRDLRDPLALPAVERLDRLPRRGCGMFNLGDCWSCLRGETRRTLRSLRGEAAAGSEPADP